MSTSNPEATKGYLVKGAVNFDLHNGSVLWFQADGGMLLCVSNLIYSMPNITLAVAPETFLRAVGFTINADTAGVIVSKIFSST